MEFRLLQEGRAALDFAADLSMAVRGLRQRVNGELAQAGVSAETLVKDVAQRDAQVRSALVDSKAFRVSNLLADWASENHGRIATAAFEAMRPQLEPRLKALDALGPTTIDPRLGERRPEYFRDVWFHRTTGGWDGHEYQGFIHAELVHRNYVFRTYPGGIFEQRARVLDELPRHDHRRILEMGASSGHYTLALAKRFPAAELHGCDISERMLAQARRVANELGLAWKLHQVPAEDTGLPAASFDLVTSYIVLHELPAAIIRQMFAEAFRVLRPGGDLLMTDVIPLWAQDSLSAWWSLHQAAMGGEPYWQEAASLDLAQVATEAGFVDAKTYGLGASRYPWVTYARKPEQS